MISPLSVRLYPQSAGPERPSQCLRLNTPFHSRDLTPPSPTAAPPPPAASHPPPCWARSIFIFTPHPLTHTHIPTKWPVFPPSPSGPTTALRRMNWSKTPGASLLIVRDSFYLLWNRSVPFSVEKKVRKISEKNRECFLFLQTTGEYQILKYSTV